MGSSASKETIDSSFIKGRYGDYGGPRRFQTFPDCLQHFGTLTPNKDAVVFCSTVAPRQSISWKELYDKTSTMAKAFVNMGVKAGDNIVVVSRDCPEYLFVAFGAMMAGARIINLVFTYKDGSDFIKVMEKIRTCVLIVLDPGLDEVNWNILKSMLDSYDSSGAVRSSKLPFLRKLVFISSPHDEQVKTIEELLSEKYESVELPHIDPEGIAVMFQTSGSTGIPKLVAHTHANLTSMGQRISGDFNSSDDIYFSVEAFSWGAGFPYGFIIGQTRVTISGFCPRVDDESLFWMDVIKKENCTVAAAVPKKIHNIVDKRDVLPEDWPLKTVFTSGQPITKSVTECLGTVCKYMGIVYGGTEVQLTSVLVIKRREEYADFCCGKPSPEVEVMIVGKDGSVLPVNEIGEIYIRLRFIFKEYLNEPDKTSAVMTSDGWFKTDDYGRIDRNGYLFVEGRISDMIISEGTNVMPSVLEIVLKSCPGVESAVVVPVPDLELYQTICACVTIKNEYEVTEDQLRDYMESVHNDDPGKDFTILPKYYMILEKFPVETRGKVSRKGLKAMAEQRFTA